MVMVKVMDLKILIMMVKLMWEKQIQRSGLSPVPNPEI
jgi:hypothetical protein